MVDESLEQRLSSSYNSWFTDLGPDLERADETVHIGPKAKISALHNAGCEFKITPNKSQS